MSKLTKEELTQIASDKNLEIVDIEKYVNLKSEMTFTCKKCGKRLISNFESVRNNNWTCPLCSKETVTYKRQPPEKSGYRIIGCDQATQKFGISVYDDEKLVYYDCIEFVGSLESRYVQIYNFMDYILKVWKPDFVAFEDIQLQGGNAGYNAFKTLAGLLGIMEMVLTKNKVDHDKVLNKVWQAKFMISGKDRITQKQNVIKKVNDLFGITVSDDIADAILIGKYACKEKIKNNVKYLF